MNALSASQGLALGSQPAPVASKGQIFWRNTLKRSVRAEAAASKLAPNDVMELGKSGLQVRIGAQYLPDTILPGSKNVSLVANFLANVQV